MIILFGIQYENVCCTIYCNVMWHGVIPIPRYNMIIQICTLQNVCTIRQKLQGHTNSLTTLVAAKHQRQ